MKQANRTLTLDSNILISALKEDEAYSEDCHKILNKILDAYTLSEPTILYQEVCGTLSRRVGRDIADEAKRMLELIIDPSHLVNCDKKFCTAAYPLCHEYSVYAIDAIYLKVALDNNAILVSLDKEDFIDKVKSRKQKKIEAYHVSEFPY